MIDYGVVGPQELTRLTLGRGPRGGLRATCGGCGATGPDRADRDSFTCPGCGKGFHGLIAERHCPSGDVSATGAIGESTGCETSVREPGAAA